MAYRTMSPRRGGAWTKVIIFISLYVLLLQSLIEWVVVLYLYGNKHVDSKMAPSLIFALIASFFTVPLVVLHSFLAWQYNRVLGYAKQKAMLHTVCTYILRLTTIVWLGASVAGLVVVSQQAYCLPGTASGSFWEVGVSCALHRAVVIVSVVSFLTVCLYFCSRELCERPYDVSLLGVYNHQRLSRDGSILSASTRNSEKSLKHDIVCVCRHPDITYGRNPFMTPSDSEESGCLPSIQQPLPIRPTSFLHFSADPSAEAEYLSGTTVSPVTQSDLYQPGVSRTPSAATSQIQTQSQALPELPGGLGSTGQQPSHTRNKSSTSSFRRFLPKSLPASLSLSLDPQIRALTESNANVDIEKQEPQESELVSQEPQPPVPPAKSPHPPPKDDPLQEIQHTNEPTITPLPRSTTMNSADAPEVVTPPAPLNIRRSNSTHNHTLPPPPPPPSLPLSSNPASSWATLLDPNQPRPLRMSTMHVSRRPSKHDTSHTPRYTQSQRFPSGRTRYSRPLRGSSSDNLYQQSGLRRPRSSTFGSVSIVSVPGHLDSIRETGASIDEMRPGTGKQGS
ncbi:hypothetical protein BJY04DRAFT_213847 [Aspergillus karnatakaensis]|uniref:uncharacterized protein n=1 Tax=Aspergillus karnatakaensis TaxID=1810916 RepID=UPI003CCE34CF